MLSTDIDTSMRWHDLAKRVLSGYQITQEDAREILQSSDDELLDLLAATYTVRKTYFGKAVQLYYLKNAKSGLCPEDCGYCSQSKIAEAPVERYSIANERVLMEGAAKAKESQARTYCIVASGRGPTEREVNHVCDVVRKIKQEHGLHICACLGLLKPDQARRLAEAGVDRINHNLNTSRRYYEEICTTHTYQDRLDTLKVAQEAGMELCSGLIVGMGEELQDILDAIFELRELDVKSIPVNFLHAIDGTPLSHKDELDPRYCLKVLCLLRLAHPAVEVRIAGGRELNLRSMQAMGLYAANSIFVSDYLTTKGQSAEDDFQMVRDLGFDIVIAGHENSSTD